MYSFTSAQLYDAMYEESKGYFLCFFSLLKYFTVSKKKIFMEHIRFSGNEVSRVIDMKYLNSWIIGMKKEEIILLDSLYISFGVFDMHIVQNHYNTF